MLRSAATTRARRRILLAPAALALLTACSVPVVPHEGGHTAGPAPHRTSDRVTHVTDPPGPPGTPSRGSARTAVGQLATLAVKGRAPMTGYDRDRFGAAWLDTDRNGCDTRNDVLRRDLSHRVLVPGTHGCVVSSGVLDDPYTRARIRFVKGEGSLVDIDHVVALGDAWVTGAFRWQVRERAALANDPMNLLAVGSSANRQKGDSDAATWLPPNRRYRCAYVARQIGVKAKYGLWVTPPEKEAMTRILATCPGRAAVPDSGAPVLAPLRLSDAGGGTDRRSGEGAYASCAQARAAGAAPLHRGDPGYSTRLDGDGDGVACE